MREKRYPIERFAARAAVVMLIILLLGIPQAGLAAEKDKNNMPVDTDINVSYIAKGDVTKAGKASFVIIAKDDTTPMPAGCDEEEKTITIDGQGEKSFGSIHIEKPDIYEYTIIRTDRRNSACKEFDNSIYHVKIMTLNNGEVEQIITKAGSNTKMELAYTDVFETPPASPSSDPRTGDPHDPIVAGMLAGLSLATILLLLARKRRQQYEKRC